MNTHLLLTRYFGILVLSLLLIGVPSYPHIQDTSHKLAQTTTQAADSSETKLPPKAHSFAPYAERAATDKLYVEEISEVQDDASRYYYQGIEHYESQHLTKAAEAFKQAVTLRPEWALPHFSLATVYSELGMYEEATNEFQETLKLDIKGEQRLRTLYNMGNVYLDEGKFENADSAYQEINKAQPKLPLVHYNMGLAYVGLGQKERAAEEFNTAVRLPPQSGDPKAQAKAHFNLGVAYFKLGRRDLAEAELKELQSLDAADLAKRLGELLHH